MKPRACPCHSGERYERCCAPLHAPGTPLRAKTPEALMRSRYSAFALGLGAYLAATQLDGGDPNELSRARENQRFLDLCILHAAGDQVLFYARIFERGVDRSFIELSSFRNVDGTWLYDPHTSVALPTTKLPSDPRAVTLEAFRAMVD